MQTVKTVVIPVPGKARNTTGSNKFTRTINGEPVPVVQEAIGRSAVSNEYVVEENIKTDRKTMHSLIGPGFYGCNGFDPKTPIKLYQLYVYQLWYIL